MDILIQNLLNEIERVNDDEIAREMIKKYMSVIKEYDIMLYRYLKHII